MSNTIHQHGKGVSFTESDSLNLPHSGEVAINFTTSKLIIATNQQRVPTQHELDSIVFTCDTPGLI